MPTINKPTKRRNDYKKHGDNAIVARIYNSQNWVKLRNAYLMQHPLCEECLAKGIVTKAEEVHHIKPILTGNNELEMQTLAYDGNNLKSLCSKCHHELHNKH